MEKTNTISVESTASALSKNVMLTLIASYVGSHSFIKRLVWSPAIIKMVEGIMFLSEEENLEVEKVFPAVAEYWNTYKNWREDAVKAVGYDLQALSQKLIQNPLFTEEEDVKEIKKLAGQLSRLLRN